MKGMSADVGRVPLPKVSVHALQAANELKNEVEQLRREVAEYQRKVLPGLLYSSTLRLDGAS